MLPTQKRKSLWAGILLLGGPAWMFGQQQAPSVKTEERVELRSGIIPSVDLELAPEAIAAMELGLDVRAIKDRPFRAQMIVESERRLADGNLIQRKKTSLFYRDQHGCLREEQTIDLPASREDENHQNMRISIKDPAKGLHYILFPRMKAGFRMQAPEGISKRLEKHRTTPWTPRRDQKVTRIVLGYQMIEGLQVEGRLETVIVPAGSNGNPFPIEISTERWYSDELQINLLVKRIDPRFGEATIRLINLSLEEPHEALFTVPVGYEIREGTTTAIPSAEKQKP
ncbi:MAG: hypothetical protein ACRD5G_15470 [Candidatus Acidiferrales bacterium]